MIKTLWTICVILIVIEFIIWHKHYKSDNNIELNRWSLIISITAFLLNILNMFI